MLIIIVEIPGLLSDAELLKKHGSSKMLLLHDEDKKAK
jgi:hypothetical protein